MTIDKFILGPAVANGKPEYSSMMSMYTLQDAEDNGPLKSILSCSMD